MEEGARRELEEAWRTRLQDAKLRLNFAQNYLKEVQSDFSSGELPAPDGRYAFDKALRAERYALAEYNRVLRIYTDLTVNGTVPDQDERLKRTAVSGGENAR